MIGKKKAACLILPAVFAAILSGCASRRGGLETYTAPEMRRQEIGSLALMPLRDIWLSTAETNQLDQILATVIATRNPLLRVRDATEVSAKLADLALTDRWQAFFDDYQVREMPDADLLRLAGEALAADAVLQGEISNVQLEDLNGRILDQLSPAQPGGTVANLAPATEGTVKISIDFAMFDTERGIRIWEAAAEGTVGIDPARPGELPLFEAARAALTRIVESLPLK